MKIFCLRFLSIALVFGFTIPSFSQHFNLDRFGTKDGIGGTYINAVIKDSRNYMWLGTQEGGISCFNGKGFKNYSTIDGLSSNDVTAICEDAKGQIWVGTNGAGISVFDGKKFIRYHDFGLDSATIYSIYKDSKSNIWISTFTQGLIRYDGKKFHQYSVANGLPTNDIFCTPEEKAMCLEHAGKANASSCMDGCSHGCKSKEECAEKCGESCAKMHKD